MKIHCLQHAPYEGLGEIGRWGEAAGGRLTFTKFYEKPQLPAAGSVDFLVVMGGPMNVYEYRAHPWLRAEKEFINRQVDRGIPVLGVCLGAQLIADVLGAKVYQNAEKEIGWLPVRWRALPSNRRLLGRQPGEVTVFQWHGDTFDLPPKSEWLAESTACAHQAFLCRRRVVGLQFHLEVGAEEVGLMARHGAGELQAGGRLVQTAEQLAAIPADLATGHALLRHLLDRLVEREV